MRVLLIHKFFHPRGGAEAAFFFTARVLERHGHQTLFFSMEHPDNLASPYRKYFVSPVDFGRDATPWQELRAAGRVLYSFEAQRRLEALIRETRPDLAHCHNIHHQLSPSILHTLRRHRIPVVMSLHDYKVACPAYNLFLGGRTCERCRGGRFYECLIHRCSKGSLARSLVNSLEMYLHHTVLGSDRLVNVYLSPSRFLKDKIAAMGFRGKVQVLPNGLDLKAYEPRPIPAKKRLLYFGRLSAEKGLRTLLDALVGTKIPCLIIGSGPLRAELRERCRQEGLTHVSFRDHLPPAALKPEISKSLGVVVPSVWYENNPYSVLESFALGRPVIASRIGGLPELVEDGRTGWTCEPGRADELRKRMEGLLAAPSQAAAMGRRGRALVRRTNDAEVYYRGLMDAYDLARSGRA